MYRINKLKNEIEAVENTSFGSLKFREREHLQEWIAKNPNCLGEELLIIQKEFDGFEDTRERLDLLALDKLGNLVLIENKLDDSGKDVVWQALKYTAYVSTLTTNQIIDIYQNYLPEEGNAEKEILEFLGEQSIDTVVLNNEQRVFLIAATFRKEVTATALWLINKGIDITCIRVTPHKIEELLLLDFEQIIPIKDAEDYLIQLADKEKENVIKRKAKRKSEEVNFEYWEQLLPILRKSTINSKAFHNVNASDDHWLSYSAGISGVAYSLKVLQKYIGIELYISTPVVENNKKIYKLLLEDKDEIEKEFGSKLNWELLENRKGSRISFNKEELNTRDKSTWTSNNDFFIDNVENFINVLSERLLVAYKIVLKEYNK